MAELEGTADEKLLLASSLISKLNKANEEKDERLRALQRAAAESQRGAAEATASAQHLQTELDAVKEAYAVLELKLKLESEKLAAAVQAHQAAAARASEELAGARKEAIVERERVAELKTQVADLTRAEEEARELWARLKEALLVRCCCALLLRAAAAASAAAGRFAARAHSSHVKPNTS
jgi:DNA repair exonuclease SbcCD ATPase subunit